MIHSKAIFTLSLLFIFYSGYTQNSYTNKDSLNTQQKKESIWQLIKYDGLSIYGGIKHVYSQPLKWKKNDWAIFAGSLVGQSILLTLDEPANSYFTKQKESIPDIIKDAGFHFGKPLINYGLTGSVYTLGLLTKNEKIRKTGVLLIASATAGGLIQTTSKTLFGRARPNVGEGNFSFRFYNHEPGYHSFMSGHAILAMTTAHAFAKQFDNIFTKSGIYALGLITPVSRLWEGAHWLTDITAGIAISIIVVDSASNYLKKEKRYLITDKKNKIRWNFRLGANQLGIVGSF
ncbi:phosphatase PAP2 family protein [Aquimarina pacifica]|uniref:phosphatase PAP2 family protein n=1 Tax=Aquimarina pacifica TaxID=1296415 RepID=UPI00047228F4|nr:phosphatase PAP2 family protein [Aquimarina pacifica]